MHAQIDAVRVAGTPDGPVPVVLLSVTEHDDSLLPIFIGFEEAISIARGLDATDLGRPLTHDLTLDVIEELGGRVDEVLVESIEERTYIATLTIETPRGTTEIDARPSDSLALAARTNAPIEVSADVFEEGQQDREALTDLTDIREVAGV